MKKCHFSAVLVLVVFASGLAVSMPAQQPAAQEPAAPRPLTAPPGYMQAAQDSLAQPFKGITTDGQVVPGLYSIKKTGVSTKPIKDAADALIASLNPQ
ncbi:MAG TPA: hypothetical protein VLD57_02885, partial [Blastocatellia bacterium]|nr:hypothetical protein [Blastocatellia bacterium]